MTDEPVQYWRRANRTILAVGLAAMIAAAAILLAGLHQAAQDVDERRRRHYLAVLAIVVALVLILAAFCLALLMIRWMSNRMRLRRRPAGPTEYVDAWALAGQRLQLPEDDSPDQAQPPDEDAGDSPGRAGP